MKAKTKITKVILDQEANAYRDNEAIVIEQSFDQFNDPQVLVIAQLKDTALKALNEVTAIRDDQLVNTGWGYYEASDTKYRDGGMIFLIHDEGSAFDAAGHLSTFMRYMTRKEIAELHRWLIEKWE